MYDIVTQSTKYSMRREEKVYEAKEEKKKSDLPCAI